MGPVQDSFTAPVAIQKQWMFPASPARVHRAKLFCTGDDEDMPRIDYMLTGSTSCADDDVRSNVSDDSHLEEVMENVDEEMDEAFHSDEQQAQPQQSTPRPEVPGGAVNVEFKEEVSADLASAIAAASLVPEGTTMASMGAALHANSECEPCAWFWKPQGCYHGQMCQRCHLCPPDELAKRRRAKKESMRAAKQQRQRLVAQQQQPQQPAVESEQQEDEITNDAAMPGNVPLAVRQEIADNTERGTVNSDHISADCVGAAVVKVVKESGSVASTDGEPARDFISDDSDAVADQAAPQRLPAALTSPTHRTPSSEDCFSLGSAMHASGECEPCAWFWKPQGCHHGLMCRRCHLCPPEELAKRRRAKKDAMRAEKRAQQSTESRSDKDALQSMSRRRSEPCPAVQTVEALLPDQAQPMRIDLSSPPAGLLASPSPLPTLLGHGVRLASLASQAAALASVPAPPGLPTPDHLVAAAELVAQANMKASADTIAADRFKRFAGAGRLSELDAPRVRTQSSTMDGCSRPSTALLPSPPGLSMPTRLASSPAPMLATSPSSSALRAALAL